MTFALDVALRMLAMWLFWALLWLVGVRFTVVQNAAFFIGCGCFGVFSLTLGILEARASNRAAPEPVEAAAG